MGRILRKKPAAAKKRRKAEAEAQPPQGGAEPASAAAEERRPAENRPVRTAPPPRKAPAQAGGGAPAGAESAERFWQRAIRFLREVKVELKKVTWPSRKQAMGSTIVVIVLVLLISTFLGLVDLALSTVVRAIFG